MTKALTTKEKLLDAARDLFWTRGYSNVSVRDITKRAGVDVALVSRYFNGKEGLFEATLAGIPVWEPLTLDRDTFLDAAIASFAHPFDPQTDDVNAFSMLLSNIIDPEMGDKIRQLVLHGLAEPLAEKIGGDDAEERAALLLAVLFGVALVRKKFQLRGLADASPDVLSDQIRLLADAALEGRT